MIMFQMTGIVSAWFIAACDDYAHQRIPVIETWFKMKQHISQKKKDRSSAGKRKDLLHKKVVLGSSATKNYNLCFVLS